MINFMVTPLLQGNLYKFFVIQASYCVFPSFFLSQTFFFFSILWPLLAETEIINYCQVQNPQKSQEPR